MKIALNVEDKVEIISDGRIGRLSRMTWTWNTAT